MVVSDDHVRCYSCAAGSAPNFPDRTTCLSCADAGAFDALTFSSLGTSCDGEATARPSNVFL